VGVAAPVAALITDRGTPDLSGIAADIRTMLVEYNTYRPHSALCGLTLVLQ
jgi:hypothetical protein